MTPYLTEPSFARLIAWELILCAAFFGWGWGVQRVLGLAGAGFGGAYGLCAVLFLSGIANVTGGFGKIFILLIAGGGCVSAAGFLFVWARGWAGERPGSWGWRAVGIVLLAFLALGQFAFRARTLEFSHVDDYQAYLAFPAKLLANGSLGAEPFSEHRLNTSLGGKYALDAMVLWGNGFKSLWGTDNAIGLVLTLASLWGAGRILGLPFWGLAVVVLWGLIVGPPAVNLTTVTLPLPIVLALHGLLREDEGKRAWGVPMAAALLLAGLVLLKNSLLPIGALVIAGHGIRRGMRRKELRALLPDAFVVGAGFFAWCSPWMMASWRDCGTPWFPVLGYGGGAAAYDGGFVYAAHGHIVARFLGAAWDLIRPGRYTPLLLAVIGLTGAWWLRRKSSGIDAILPWAGLLSAGFILMEAPSPQGDRFAFVGAMAGAYWGGAALLRGAGNPRARMVMLGFACVTVTCSVGENLGNGRLALYQGMLRNPIRVWRNLSRVAKGDLVPASDAERYAAAQAVLPAGAVVFDRTLRPFLWDFHRNAIRLAEYPGAASPRPGMPIGQGPGSLRAYLLAQGVGFVAYDYAAEAGLSQGVFGRLVDDAKTPPWQRSQYGYALKVQGDLAGLHTVCPRVFDDGAMEILALRP